MGKKVQQAANYVGKVAENIIKNPLPLIETVVLISVGVPPPLASAAVTAANGGSMKDVVVAGTTAYAGGEIGQAASAEATSAGASTEVAKITASAAGASTGATLTALANGQSLDKALETGLAAGALAGTTTGVVEEGKAALTPEYTGQGIKAVPGQGTQLLGDQTSVSGLGLTDKVPTGGGQGLTVDPATVLYSSQFAPSTGKVRGTEEGGLQPAYTSAANTLTPPSFDSSLTGDVGYKEPKTVTEKVGPPLTPAEEAVAKKFVSTGLSDLFGLGPKVPGAPSVGGTGAVAQGSTTGVTAGLAGERGAGEIESKETGKQRQSVWNEESLRLKDALGV